MILPAQTIRALCLGNRPMISPFTERIVVNGMSAGLSSCGYDIRIAEDIQLWPQGKAQFNTFKAFSLASTIEAFNIPTDIMMEIKDKSTWARLGIAVQNTIAEPGWKGETLTLEISNHGPETVRIEAGSPIAQAVFHRLEEATELVYSGKYHNAPKGAQEAIFEHSA